MMMAWNLYLLIFNQWDFHDLLDDTEGGDEEWSFGQIMPLLLLILPAMTIVEALLGTLYLVFALRSRITAQSDMYGISADFMIDPIKEEEDEGSSPQVQAVAQRPSASDENQGDELPSPPVAQAQPVPQRPSTSNGLKPSKGSESLSKDSESTRITAFLMFEFALVFVLLAIINYVTTPSNAAKVLGYGLVVTFIVCLVAAPLVFAYTIHLADMVTTSCGWDVSSAASKFCLPSTSKFIEKKNVWLRSSIAVIVALAIGFAIVVVAIAAFVHALDI